MNSRLPILLTLGSLVLGCAPTARPNEADRQIDRARNNVEREKTELDQMLETQQRMDALLRGVKDLFVRYEEGGK